MGTDIHLIAQIKDDGKWKQITDLKTYSGRNYYLFAILADVRNNGCFEPIDYPRGFPKDFIDSDITVDTQYLDKPEYREDFTSELSFASRCDHSQSWFTLQELLDFDWDWNRTGYEGWLTEGEYKCYSGEPICRDFPPDRDWETKAPK